MNMLLGEQLSEALAKKANDINTFTWKGKKVKVNGQYVQEEIKMVDCSVEQLQQYYEHCKIMLDNTNYTTPGRRTLLKIIKDQRDRCNAELFVRWINQEKNLPSYVFLSSLRECLNNNPHLDPKIAPIEMIVGGCPNEFKNMPIDLILDACMDTLGYFNKQHLTLTFIIKQGVWFTNDELKKMQKEGVTDRIAYAKQKIGINSDKKNDFNFDLKVNPKGLSFEQMKAMVSLRNKKYSEFTTLQLETLRNRVLFSLENEVNYHIKQWERRMEQLRLVLQSKGVDME